MAAKKTKPKEDWKLKEIERSKAVPSEERAAQLAHADDVLRRNSTRLNPMSSEEMRAATEPD